MKLTGAQALVKSLEMHQVEVVFGMPGGAILPLYDPLIDSAIRHVLVRHEQGAGHMAEGYAQVTAHPGVAFVTSGPGATNIVTPLCTAYADSTPVVVISGQVARSSIGTDAFQECDTTAITSPITKHNWLVWSADEIPFVVRQAFHLATSGTPGPVLIDLPKDVSTDSMDWYWPSDDEIEGSLCNKAAGAGDTEAIEAAAKLILRAQRPLVCAGGGILASSAAEALGQMVDLTGSHLVTTVTSPSAFADPHSSMSMKEADVVIAVGSSFHDQILDTSGTSAPEAPVVSVGVAPAALGAGRPSDVNIVGDAKLVIEALVEFLRSAGPQQDRSAWINRIAACRQSSRVRRENVRGPEGVLAGQDVVARLRASIPKDAIVVSGVGAHSVSTERHWYFDRPYTWVGAGESRAIGFALPAAIGAKIGRPDRMVWAVDDGDCFQMTAQELVTASREQVPIKVAILDGAPSRMVPDFVKWAQAMGCAGLRADQAEEVDAVVNEANAIDDRTVVVAFRCDEAGDQAPAGG
jgi:acetolactate synthase-1/2/3 large subunit